MRKIYQINEFANKCGYFYNGYLKEGATNNNGYNCSHPKQESFEIDDKTKIKTGNCYCFSCPLGCEADEEDFNDEEIDNNGWEAGDEEEFIVVEET